MAQKINKINRDDIETITVVNERDSEQKERKLYEINKSKKEVKVFHRKYGSADDYYVLFEGFTKIPDVFSEGTNSDNGTLDSLQSHIEKYHYKRLIISKNGKNQAHNKEVIINYQNYKELLEEIDSIKGRVRILKQRARSKFLKYTFPDIFSELKTSFPSICDSISEEIINEEVLKRLNFEKLQEIVRNSVNVIEKKHGTNLIDFHKGITVVSNLPVLKKVAYDLKKLMDSRSKTEHDFSQFLMSTFPLLRFDCVYLEKNLNLICAGARKTDFLMVNSEGFADIFEIKTPKLRMLQFDKSHNNFYWSPDASKAIAQIEKYLHDSEKNSLSIMDSLSKRGISISLIKPKGILIMGSNEELTDNKEGKGRNKLEDFRILKNSLKNIEIMTYSDLLRSVSNLVSSNEIKK